MAQMVHVDEREGEFIVTSYSRTTAGFGVWNGWLRRLPVDTEDDDLGAAVESGLDASETNVETPGPDANLIGPLLKVFGLRSYGAYMTGTRAIAVSRDGSAVEVIPYRNDGRRGGFTPLPERAECLESPSRPRIGKAARAALQRTL